MQEMIKVDKRPADTKEEKEKDDPGKLGVGLQHKKRLDPAQTYEERMQEFVNKELARLKVRRRRASRKGTHRRCVPQSAVSVFPSFHVAPSPFASAGRGAEVGSRSGAPEGAPGADGDSRTPEGAADGAAHHPGAVDHSHAGGRHVESRPSQGASAPCDGCGLRCAGGDSGWEHFEAHAGAARPRRARYASGRGTARSSRGAGGRLWQ